MKKLTALSLSLGGIVLSAKNVLADSVNLNPYGIPTTSPTAIISNVIKLIFFVAFLLAFIFLLIGGIKWITSNGNDAAVKGARQTVIHALIGLVIVILSLALVVLIQNLLGVHIFDSNFVIPSILG